MAQITNIVKIPRGFAVTPAPGGTKNKEFCVPLPSEVSWNNREQHKAKHTLGNVMGTAPPAWINPKYIKNSTAVALFSEPNQQQEQK